MRSRLGVTRSQILGFRRSVGALDQRLAPGQRSLRRAAWAGLQDSMPRAALLWTPARVAGTHPSTWEDPSGGERDAVAAEAASLPLPGLQGRIGVRWDDRPGRLGGAS